MIRAVLFLMMAAGLFGFSFVAWKSLNPPPPPTVEVAKVDLLAAAGTLRAGTLLKPDDLEVKQVLEGDVPTGARKDTPQARSELFGAMVRQTILAHEVILPADVMRPGDHGFLAAVLTPGKRATSVAVDATTGIAGLIWPGDHVDLVLTQDLAGENVPNGKRIVGETVLQDVRVIAIDQQLVEGSGAGGPGDANASRTVTLEVTPQDVERVAVAQRLGRLSLAMRPVDAGPTPDLTTRDVTTGADVSKALDATTTQAQTAGPTVHVYEGTGKEDIQLQ